MAELKERMTAGEYAVYADVNKSTVCRWLQHGRIEKDADGLINRLEADVMRVKTESPEPHHQARKDQIEEAKAAKRAAIDSILDERPHPLSQGAIERFKEARAVGALLDNKKKDLDIKKMANELVSISEAESFAASVAIFVRDAGPRSADRWAHRFMEVDRDPRRYHELLIELFHEHATDVADTAIRLADQLKRGKP